MKDEECVVIVSRLV